MLFNSIEFLIFLPLVFFGYWFAFKSLRWQNLFVVAVSYLFYGWWDWRFLLLILFTSLCSYLSGVYLEKCAGNRSVQKWISAGNILLNLSILGVFKYFDFFYREFGKCPSPIGLGCRLRDVEYLAPCRDQLLYVSGFELYD